MHKSKMMCSISVFIYADLDFANPNQVENYGIDIKHEACKLLSKSLALSF